ncbi:RagB/SusD family nutrient uptake outer membrane protein [Niabella aquatica]
MKMKGIIYILLLGLIFTSCKKYLDPKIDTSLSDEEVWSDPDYSLGVLMATYSSLPGFYDNFGNNFLDVATDDAVSNDYGSVIKIMAMGGWTVAYNPLDSWSNCYIQIRNANKFLENGGTARYSYDSTKNAKIRKRSKGEAYYMRAWYEWELLQRFGGKAANDQFLGFPIVTKVLSTQDPASINIPRNMYEDCVGQITADLDSAIKYLPLEYSGSDDQLGSVQVGRASGMAAKALKARLYLYAASPAFAKAFSEMTQQQLWERAAKAAREVMVNAGSLPAIDFNAPANFYNNPNHADFIWRKYAGDSNGPESRNFIPSLWGSGLTNPSQQLVDAFPTSNGYPVTDANAVYNPQNPYINRDKRLGWNILVNGASFKGTAVETFEKGKDTEEGRYNKATLTGYYLRKWMHDGVSLQPGGGGTAKHFYAFLRKTEVWLNYAEAANEAWGPDADPLGLGITATTALKAIRTRAGFSADNYLSTVTAAGKEAFRQLVRNERRIELCFENHRFFDLRRWMVPLSELSQTVKGVKIIKNANGGFSFDYSRQVQKLAYLSNMYYGPIPESVVYRSNNIVQNKGW